MSTADKLNKLITTKAAIKQALIDKGLNPSDVFSTYADDIRSISSGGGSGLEFDFTVLGYNLEECKDANDIANAAISLGDFTQSLITEAIAYGKELYDSNYKITDSNVDNNKLLFYPKLKLPFIYKNSKVLYIPNVEYNASGGSTTGSAYTNHFLYKVGSINAEFTSSSYSLGFFNNCYSLREVGDINITGEVIDYKFFFQNCYALRKIGNLNTTGSTDFTRMFSGCSLLTTIQLLNTSSGTSFDYMFSDCPNLKRIEGISLKSLNKTVNLFYLTGFSSINTLRYALIKDIGTCTDMTNILFTYWIVWGIDDETNTDARQSLIDSLLTYSFDRATAGYSTCTITLSSNTKALLTEDEIAQITIKGYTIA